MADDQGRTPTEAEVRNLYVAGCRITRETFEQHYMGAPEPDYNAEFTRFMEAARSAPTPARCPHGCDISAGPTALCIVDGHDEPVEPAPAEASITREEAGQLLYADFLANHYGTAEWPSWDRMSEDGQRRWSEQGARAFDRMMEDRRG